MSNQETDQHQLFKDKARELGADESEDALDRSLDRLELRRKETPEAAPSTDD